MSSEQEHKSEMINHEKENFIKQKGAVFLEDGKLVYPEQKYFEQDLNYQFTFDTSKYLGEFKCEYYHLSRKYLNTMCHRKNLRLYYTCARPVKQIKANFLLIHGFGEHSSRYMEVKFKFYCFILYLIN